MSNDTDLANDLAARVRAAAAEGTALAICGSGSKRFLTGEPPGEALAVAGHRGIVSHEPTELVLSARAGTPLAEIEAALAAHGQMLGFEPPHFGAAATLGGTLACGLSGPRRPYAGSARDFVLGATIVNGAGEVLEFGGQVMKNVAGYDLSRLMVGAFGSLGVLLEVSLKVLPRPARELTLAFELGAAEALRRMNDWAGRPLPLSAAGHLDGRLYLRLSGSEQGVAAARAKLGGEPVNDGDSFWRALREHELDFFAARTPLWRLSLPPAAPPLDLPGRQLIDWGGAQRWLASDAPAATIQAAAAGAGGYATPFRHGPGAPSAFAGLDPTLHALHARLQRAFDPRGVFARALALDAAA